MGGRVTPGPVRVSCCCPRRTPTSSPRVRAERPIGGPIRQAPRTTTSLNCWTACLLWWCASSAATAPGRTVSTPAWPAACLWWWSAASRLPDADLMERSTVPAGIAVQAHTYLAQGGVDNLRGLHDFVCDTLLMTGFGFAPPVETPSWGVLERAAVSFDGSVSDPPTIAVLYYRAQQLAGNTAYVEALCAAIERVGGRPLPVYCTSLRTLNPNC